MEKFAAAFKKVQKINKAIIGAVLLLMIGVVFLQTFCRFVIFKSLTWSEELSRYLFVALIVLIFSFGLIVKKSLDDLARSMSLNVDRVWVRSQGTEVLMPITKVKAGDEIIVRSGNMVPLDGTVIEGEAMVNQAALTGESMPVR